MSTPADNPLKNPHPLPPDGSFQGGRLPAALATDYVGVDEKSVVEGVEFTRRLAALFHFVNKNGVASGNWTAFYERHPAVVTARLISWPLEQLGQHFAAYRELIEDHQSPLPKEQLLLGIFDLLSSAVVALDELTERLPVASPLRQKAEALIKKQLAPAYRRWLQYYLAANPVYFGALGADEVPGYLRDTYAAGGPLINTADLLTDNLSLNGRWTEEETWTDYLGNLTSDPIVFGPGPLNTEPEAEIIHALGHTFFHGIYEAFVSSALHLRAGAQTYWDALLQQPTHQPHLALLLTFLEMREAQRAMLNELTDKHLDFYYRRVLRTTPAASQPPQVHLVLEARKNMPAAYLLPGTTFRGGKDEQGRQRSFISQEGVNVLPARIVHQRALFKVHNSPEVYDFPGENRVVFPPKDAGRLYAATVVNSPDGAGEEDMPEGTVSWDAFGHKSKQGNTLKAGMPAARLGFVLASHYLFLQEGDRTITFRFTGSGLNALKGQSFKIFLSTAKGWLQRKASVENDLRLSISLEPDDPAILPYSEDVHGLGITTAFPVARFELPHDEMGYAYYKLRNSRVTQIQIGLNVTGLRKLVLSGPTGPLDSAQAFYPFGPAPRQNSVFNIGANELFQKRGANATLYWGWQNSHPNGVSTQLERLNQGVFGLIGASFNHTGSSGSKTFSIDQESMMEPTFADTLAYQSDSVRGFVRLRLNGHYGHAGYPKALAGWTAGKSGFNEPSVPFDPKMTEVSLSYTVIETDSNVMNGQAITTEYFHLTPFGSQPTTTNADEIDLLPSVFPNGDWGADAGALLVGIEQWEPGPVLSLLFQIEEGTADPLLEKPTNHLLWHYLDGNEWKSFGKQDLVDGTDQLLRSGLVNLELPQNLSLDCSRMGTTDIQWIRISALTKTKAINQLQGIHLNGVRVVQVFAEGQIAGNEPLPAETITKMLVPLPGVKKTTQPYPSFNGAAPEERDEFYTRLSERLRHNERALMEWDVEHLVLQAFPEVERVICLNHLEFAPGAAPGQHIYHELRAGHFTVIPLGRASIDTLRPYVSLSTREAITDFLRKRISCHATLHVRNPLVEEVRVVAKVRFHKAYDDAWAFGQIQKDLIGYLSPWQALGLGSLDFRAGVQQSSVVNFLEELEYVDVIKDLVLLHLADPAQNNEELLRPTKLVSVLASALSHNFSPLPQEEVVVIPEVCSPGRPRRRAQLITENNPEG
ncbi:baseplate J/gp47 family protein [Neolewinella persica]|uniref:baseplate J/gp47 family protein n=1 Tax=Neolewinella persica TaxID=70998 RepID=UPI00035EFFB0|nr:baseplate J/gp47 family protein [Neolewinella persica]